MLSRAGIDRLIPRAGLLMMLAANIPDADLLWSFGHGTADYLRLHRGITHSLIASPVTALVPVAIVALIARKRLPWMLMWAASWIGVLSHLALDWTNGYGVRLLLPVSG